MANCKYYLVSGEGIPDKEIDLNEYHKNLVDSISDSAKDRIQASKEKIKRLSEYEEDRTFLESVIYNNSKLPKNKLTPISAKFIKNDFQKHARLLSDGILVPNIEAIKQYVLDPNSFIKNYENNENIQKVIDAIEKYKDSVPLEEIIDKLVDDKIGFKIDEVEFQDNEVMMSNIHQEQFLMNNGDQPKDVTVKEFERRLNNRILPMNNSIFDYFLRKHNGNHTYILVNNSDNFEKIKFQLDDLDFPSYKDDNGNVIRLDKNGEEMYNTQGLKFYKRIDPDSGVITEYILLDSTDELNKLQTIISSGKYEGLAINYASKLGDKYDIAIKGLEYLSNYGTNKQKETSLARLNLFNSVLNDKLDISYSDLIRSRYSKEDLIEKINSLDNQINESNNELKTKSLIIKRTALNSFLENYDSDQVEEIAKTIDINDKSELSVKLKSYISPVDVKNKRVYKMLENAYLSDLKDIMFRNKKKAIDMHSSFQTSLDFLTARIPGQDKQSYMSTKIVSFLYDVNNIAMVNPYNLWFTGGDYDVDKVYSMGYTVMDGKIVGWSKYFNYSNYMMLRAAMMLPHPDKRQVSFNPVSSTTLTEEDINNIRQFKQAFDERNQMKVNYIYKNFVTTMRKIQEDSYKVENLSEEPKDITEFLNDYFAEEIPKSYEEAGLFNTYIHELNMSSRDIANQAHHQRAMDMGEVQAAGEKSTKTEQSTTVTALNPANVAEFKETNMIGKKVVGIVATGLKVYSAFCTYYMNKLKKSDFNSLPFVNNVMLKIKDETGKDVDVDMIYNAIGTINFDRLYDSALKFASSDDTIDSEDFIKKMTLMNEQNESTSLVISSLLSAATDNAKELILGKINSDPETSGMYMYALMMGNDFSRFASKMISKEADLFIGSSKKNVYNEQTSKRSLDMYTSFEVGKRDWIYNNYVNMDNLNFSDKIYFINKLLNSLSKTDIKLVTKTAGYFTTNENMRLSISSLFKAAFDLHVAKKINIKLDKVLAASPISNFQYTDKKLSASDDEDTDIQQEEDIDLYTIDEEDSGSGVNANAGNINISRIINELDKLKDSFSGISVKKIEELNNIYIRSKSLNLFGRLLSINQGVKSDQASLLSHYNLIGKLIDHQLGIYNKTNKNLVILNDRFDLKSFLYDENYAKAAINEFDIIKTDLNYLDIIDKTPHFREMLKADLATYDFHYQRSIKFRSIINNRYDFFDYFVGFDSGRTPVNYTPSNDQVIQISNFIDNAMIIKFLRDGGFYINTPAKSFIKILDNQKGLITVKNKENKLIDLGKLDGRASFVEWFENEIIPNLQNGVTKDINGELISNKFLENNIFIDELKFDYKEDKSTKNIYQILKPGISTMNIKSLNDKNEFENHRLGFNKLANVEYFGQNVLNMLYLYNLIVNKNKGTGSSFTIFFEKSSDNMNPEVSYYHRYSKYISDLDLSEDDINIKEFTNSNFYLSQEVKGLNFPKFKKVSNSKLSNEKYGDAFFKKVIKGQYTDIYIPKGYNEKYILLTDQNQLSNASEKPSIETKPDVDANKMILNSFVEYARKRFNINIDLIDDKDQNFKASLNSSENKIVVNTAYASAAEPMHELMHVILEAINFKENGLYSNIIGSIKYHPLYDDIAKDYPELTGKDLDEEVFVNVFTNLYNKKVQTDNSALWNNMNDDLFRKIDQFVDESFKDLLNESNLLNKSLFDVSEKLLSSKMNDAYVSLSLYDGETEMYKKLKDIGLEEECDGQGHTVDGVPF